MRRSDPILCDDKCSFVPLGTDARDENYKQIVLTADRKAHEISEIADRLSTRVA